MQKGDIVTIYLDPITKEKPEGIAKLITKHNMDHPYLEYWDVCFMGESMMVSRWINKS